MLGMQSSASVGDESGAPARSESGGVEQHHADAATGGAQPPLPTQRKAPHRKRQRFGESPARRRRSARGASSAVEALAVSLKVRMACRVLNVTNSMLGQPRLSGSGGPHHRSELTATYRKRSSPGSGWSS